jgi:hypothetical protein
MPRGPRTVAVTFGARSLTHYGGVYLLHRFLSRIGFKHAVALQVRVVQRNHRYSIGEMLRQRILLMPAQLRRTHNRRRLVLPAGGSREAAWKYALHQIQRLTP